LEGSLDEQQAVRFLYFKDAEVFTNLKKATKEAYRMTKEHPILEYGIELLVFTEPLKIYERAEAVQLR
jgi:hypothetical protein